MNSVDPPHPPPPIDPELSAPLTEILAGRPPSLLPEAILADRARAFSTVLDPDTLCQSGYFYVGTEKLTTYDAEDLIDLVVMTPVDRVGPTPVVLSIHGGGMVAGHARSPELVPELKRAVALGSAVVSVGYRLAPEHRHPVPAEDCYSALEWVVENAQAHGFDIDRVFVSGVSAGGALAAAVALLARDRGGPVLRGQVLLCPMLDDRVASGSARQMTGHGLWDTVSNETGWSALLGGCRGGPGVSPYAAPARAVELSGLPPAYVDVGTYESLRDDSLDYAGRLADAGVDVELHMWGGAFHSFDEWVPEARVSKTAQAVRIEWMRRHLGG
jgi:acetyl esterase/lipase